MSSLGTWEVSTDPRQRDWEFTVLPLIEGWLDTLGRNSATYFREATPALDASEDRGFQRVTRLNIILAGRRAILLQPKPEQTISTVYAAVAGKGARFAIRRTTPSWVITTGGKDTPLTETNFINAVLAASEP